MNNIICSCVRRNYNLFIGKLSISAVELLVYPLATACLSFFVWWLRFQNGSKKGELNRNYYITDRGSNAAYSQVFLNKQ